jgi:hypothetical protein
MRMSEGSQLRFSEEKIKFIFDHLRNLIICGTITGAGIYAGKFAIKHENHLDLALAFIVAFIGVGLFAYNFMHFLLRAIETQKGRLLLAFIAPLYFLIGSFLYQTISRSSVGL